MQGDKTTRILLALIFVCLFVLMIQGFGRDPVPVVEPSSRSFDPENARYTLQRAGQHFLRFDSQTGQVWRAPSSGKRGWRLVADSAPPPGQTSTSGPGRYRLNVDRSGATTLLITDLESGRVWRFQLTPKSDEGWTEVVEEVRAAKKRPRSRSPEGAKDGAVDDAELALSDQDLLEFSDTLEGDYAPELRVVAAELLGETQSDRALPPLLRALRDEDPAVVVAAVRAMRTLGNAKVVPVLRKLQTDHEDEQVKLIAGEVIAELQ